MFQRFQLAMCLTLGLGFSMLAGLATPVVQLLFGEAWMGVVPILTWLAIGGIFKGIDSANYQIWVAKGLTGSLVKTYMVSRPLMILIILLGLPWGPVGVAIGHLVAAAGFWAFSLWFVCRMSGLDSRPLYAQTLRALALVIVPAGFVAHVVSAAIAEPQPALLFGSIAALGWAVLVSLAIRPLRRDVLPLWRAARAVVGRSAR
jgi:PST family polysaccharide transporter